MQENEQTVLSHPEIEADSCKGCGRCVAACPRHCLELQTTLNKSGVKPVGYKCFYNCPEPYAIKVVKA